MVRLPARMRTWGKRGHGLLEDRVVVLGSARYGDPNLFSAEVLRRVNASFHHETLGCSFFVDALVATEVHPKF